MKRTSSRSPAPAPGPLCGAYAELLPVLDEDSVDLHLAGEVRAHLVECAYCRARRAEYAALDDALRRAFQPETRSIFNADTFADVFMDSMREDIMSELLQPDAPAEPPTEYPTLPSLRPPDDHHRSRRILSGVGAVAAVLVLALLAQTLVHSRHAAPLAGAKHPTATATQGQGYGPNISLSSISMTSASDGWAVGGTMSDKNPDAGYLMHFIGGQWAPVTAPSVPWLKSISMSTASDGWAVGNGGMMWQYDGNTWSQIVSPASGDLYAVQMLSPKLGWAVGDDPMTASATDSPILRYNGTSWESQPLPRSLLAKLSGITLMGISMLSSGTGWAVGYANPVVDSVPNGSSVPNNGIILRYSNGTWALQASFANATLKSISMVSGQEGWAVGERDVMTGNGANTGTSATPLLLHYLNGVWHTTRVPTGYLLAGNETLLDVQMISPTDGWIVTDATAFLHYTGGVWQEVALPQLPDGYLWRGISSVQMLSSDEGWAVGGAGKQVGQTDGFNGNPSYITAGSPWILHYSHGVWTTVID